jgi:hypothetical protein
LAPTVEYREVVARYRAARLQSWFKYIVLAIVIRSKAIRYGKPAVAINGIDAYGIQNLAIAYADVYPINTTVMYGSERASFAIIPHERATWRYVYLKIDIDRLVFTYLSILDVMRDMGESNID